MSIPPPQGIYVPVPTFFKSAPTKSNPIPELDLATQLEHGLHLAKNGIKGLVLLGSSGEAIALSTSERNELVSYMRKGFDNAGFKDYPLIAGTTAQGISDVIEQLSGSEEAGAGWGMVLAPGFFAAGGASVGIQAWYEAVADKSPLPILIYHYPGVSNNIAITPTVVSALAKHKNIVGCKLSHGNLSHTAQIASSPETDHSHFFTFTGLGQQLLPVLSVGGVGAIDGLAGIFPKTVVRLFTLYNNKDEKSRDEMRKLQYQIAAGYGLIEKYGILGIKAGVRTVLGLGSEMHMRLPLIGSEEPAKEFDSALRTMIKVEKEIQN